MKRWTLSGLVVALVVVSIPMAVWFGVEARARRRSAEMDALGLSLVGQLRATPATVWVQTLQARAGAPLTAMENLAAANPDIVGMSVVPVNLGPSGSIDTFGSREPLTFLPTGGSRTIGDVTVISGTVAGRPVRMYKAETPVGAGRLKFIVILPEPD